MKDPYRRVIQPLVAIVLIGAALVLQRGAVTRQEEVLQAVHGLTGAPTKLVWCQDFDKLTDLGGHGWRLRLLCFDSEEETGVRPLMNEVSNNARPLITPSGERVVVSSRVDSQVYVVNWDGSGLRPLVRGFGLDVWRDPATGVEWLYFGGDPYRTFDPEERRFSAVLRCPIDRPGAVEVVWDALPLTIPSENNFQVSADGTHASLASSNHCLLVDLEHGSWSDYGEGRYPSLASSDDVWLAWMSPDLHAIEWSGTARADGREVLAESPGYGHADGCLFRWGNDGRTAVLSGPVADTDDQTAMEIYIGRIDPAAQGFERWVRVTYNRRADFMGDVWVGQDPARGAAGE